MKLNDDLQNRIATLLLPFVQTHAARQELMSASWGPNEPLSDYIDLSGAPRPFADRLLYQTSRYRRPSGRSAIEDVLAQLRRQVGVAQQAEIDEILSWLQRNPRLLHAPAPYKGLEAYEEEDAGYFFGRADLVAGLLQRITAWDLDPQAMRFLAIIGASGCGKSSLVRAGLLPRLREARRWRVIVIRPGADPLISLAAPLLTSPPNSTEPVRQLAGELLAAETTLATLVQQRLSDAWAACDGVLLVVDQFEELFTAAPAGDDGAATGAAHAARAAFVNNLLYAASAPAGALRLIMTLRADFYHRCADYDRLRAALSEHQEYIGAMDLAALREVIERPSTTAGYQLQEGLTAVILDDLSAVDGRPEPGSLPLLSHALLQTWRQRQGFTLTLADYQAAGGVKGALRATAEQVYTALKPTEQAAARSLFGALTELSGDAEDTRRRVDRAELAALGHDRELLERVLHKLIQVRLLVTDQPPDAVAAVAAGTDFAHVEVAHEALIRAWPRLRGWLEEDRVRLRVRRLLTAAAQAWVDHQQEDSYLYRGARLRQAQTWATGARGELGPQEAAFLQASLSHERALRWQRYGGGLALLLLLVVAAFLAGTAIQRRQWRSQALAMSELVDAPGATVMACPPRDQRVICSATDPGAVAIVVEPFAMEKYEVSNAQYRLCRKAGACTADPIDARYGQTVFDSFPVQGVDAFQAGAYCRWIGRQLPSELQWEVALGPGPVAMIVSELSPVRTTLHQAPSGVVNLLGNVKEWTRSFVQADPASGYKEVLWDGEQQNLSLSLVVRGSSVKDSAIRDEVRSDQQDVEPFSVGMRCVTQANE
jgi:formylglycine-generating enzyme required for sulfatase activity